MFGLLSIYLARKMFQTLILKLKAMKFSKFFKFFKYVSYENLGEARFNDLRRVLLFLHLLKSSSKIRSSSKEASIVFWISLLDFLNLTFMIHYFHDKFYWILIVKIGGTVWSVWKKGRVQMPWTPILEARLTF